MTCIYTQHMKKIIAHKTSMYKQTDKGVYILWVLYSYFYIYISLVIITKWCIYDFNLLALVWMAFYLRHKWREPNFPSIERLSENKIILFNLNS